MRTRPGPAALLMACALLVALFSTLWAASPDALKKDITREKGKAEQQKSLLERLTAQERKLYRNLAGVEDRMAALERDLDQQSRELERISREEAGLESTIAAIRKQQQQTRTALQGLLNSLWPVHLQSVQNQLNAFSSWAEADRQFSWMAAIYGQVDQSFRDLERQHDELVETLTAREQARTRHLAKLEDIEKTKERLLGERLSFLSKVQEVRARKLEGEEQLQQILGAIESLQIELKNITTARSFKALQGNVPWPVFGKVISRFDLSANPPRRGIGLALNGPEPVSAVSWGKVVHNDQLRGFGQVVILAHGNDFYSLYAFLSESALRVGQNVERGEPIGNAGYYPLAKGPGLYFELRSGQKAVNPLQWLSTANENVRRP